MSIDKQDLDRQLESDKESIESAGTGPIERELLSGDDHIIAAPAPHSAGLNGVSGDFPEIPRSPEDNPIINSLV